MLFKIPACLILMMTVSKRSYGDPAGGFDSAEDGTRHLS